MAVYRVDVLTDDSQRVFGWIRKNVPDSQVLRIDGFRTVGGDYVKCVFRRQTDAEAFHRAWYPERTDHTVGPVGEGPTPIPEIDRVRHRPPGPPNRNDDTP